MLGTAAKIGEQSATMRKDFDLGECVGAVGRANVALRVAPYTHRQPRRFHDDFGGPVSRCQKRVHDSTVSVEQSVRHSAASQRRQVVHSHVDSLLDQLVFHDSAHVLPAPARQTAADARHVDRSAKLPGFHGDAPQPLADGLISHWRFAAPPTDSMLAN